MKPDPKPYHSVLVPRYFGRTPARHRKEISPPRDQSPSVPLRQLRCPILSAQPLRRPRFAGSHSGSTNQFFSFSKRQGVQHNAPCLSHNDALNCSDLSPFSVLPEILFHCKIRIYGSSFCNFHPPRTPAHHFLLPLQVESLTSMGGGVACPAFTRLRRSICCRVRSNSRPRWAS